MNRYLHIGGVVAVGFDKTGEYLLVITHSGRGVFSTTTWERVARDKTIAYPSDGIGIGIGPIDGERIPIEEIDYNTGEMTVMSDDGRIQLDCESSGIGIELV